MTPALNAHRSGSGAATATQLAWGVLDLGAHPPPRPAAGAVCWLCGGATDGVGWPRAEAIPSTFASHTLAAAPASDAVCQACAALAVGATWQRYVAERRPAGVKTWVTASWRCYSHLFAAPAHHECPKPERWRAILLDPPEPPFVAAITTSGQKNLIFRAPVARSRTVFGVQFEEECVLVERFRFAGCLAALEAMSALGIAKEQARTGRYHPESLRRAGLAAAWVGEEALRPWRQAEPGLLDLVAWVGRGPKISTRRTGPHDLRV